MNLKLKRLVRTPTSEQYALFDLDQIDSELQPATIGKLDLHFTAEGMYGTLLIWDDGIRALSALGRRAFVRALLADLAQPMGVPNEYVVEFFAPSLEHYEVIHNVGLDDEDDPDEDDPDEEDPQEDDPEVRDSDESDPDAGDLADVDLADADLDEYGSVGDVLDDDLASNEVDEDDLE